VVAELLAAALVSYPPPGSQGLRVGADPERTAVAIPRRLRRPLRLPSLRADGTCPVSRRQVVSSRFSPALGPGPAYPAIFDEQSTLHFGGAAFPPPWTGQKVLWIVAPGYRGPLLIRGHQVGGKWWLGFDSLTSRPWSEMHLKGNGTWLGYPSYTRLREAGCYAYQVDGTTFSRVIVFRAAP
jgi:hypothetical protein